MSGPEFLYHYTSASGLAGIVRERQLWATDAEFLNDAQELRYGRDEVYNALVGRANELERSTGPGAPDGSRATLMRSAADHLRPGGLYAARDYHSVYVTCFCENGDLLSQWRGYGTGGGYAIGFRTDDLTAMTGPEGLTPPGLAQVGYGDLAVRVMVDKVVSEIAPEPVGFPGAHGYFLARDLVLPALGKVKHPAFVEEKEWRLLTVGDARPIFRTDPSGIIPYVVLALSPRAIKEVVIGPPHSETRSRGARRLLEAHGLAEVCVRESDAPYRG